MGVLNQSFLMIWVSRQLMEEQKAIRRADIEQKRVISWSILAMADHYTPGCPVFVWETFCDVLELPRHIARWFSPLIVVRNAAYYCQVFDKVKLTYALKRRDMHIQSAILLRSNAQPQLHKPKKYSIEFIGNRGVSLLHISVTQWKSGMSSLWRRRKYRNVCA